jgi:hypothetical protein
MVYDKHKDVEVILACFKLVIDVRFEVLMVVTIQSVVFWDVKPCSLVHGYHFLDEAAAFIFRAN